MLKKYAYLNTYMNILFVIKISIQNSTNKLRNFWYKRSATGYTAYPFPATIARGCTKLVTAVLDHGLQARKYLITHNLIFIEGL